jgi:hypothetical protein
VNNVPAEMLLKQGATEEQALGFLPVELADRRERMLYKVGQVLVDVAKQNEEILEALKRDK